GVMLYRLLTGELPFRGNTRMLLHQVLRDEPRPPRSLNDRVPRDLETICLKALAKDPRRRYQTAAELAEDLHRFVHNVPIRARPPGRWDTLTRWCRRNPAAATASGLAILASVALVALGLGSWFTLSLQSEQQRTQVALDESQQQRARADRVAASLRREQQQT